MSDGATATNMVYNNETYKYSAFTFRREEKFSVLPRYVRNHIESVLLNWLLKSPKTRLCLGNELGMSLTVLAHSTHHLHMDWRSFTEMKLDDGVLLRVLRCFKNTVPEPGTYMGEIVAQFFQHCKQQTNLNVKRKLDTSNDTTTPERNKRSAIDEKFETVMSLKRLPRVTIMFRAIQKIPFVVTKRTENLDHTNADCSEGENTAVGSVLRRYLAKRVFGALRCTDGRTSYLNLFQHSFTVRQFSNLPNEEIYFSLDVMRGTKYDSVLDNIFESVHLYNLSLDGVQHRIGECNVVFCSDTIYFIHMSKRLFVDNAVTFMYCFLTDKYKPVIESKEDTDAFGLAKILSSVEYSTKCSLKRNHNSKMGHGPLTGVISEGGLNESAKFVNKLVRDQILDLESGDEYRPVSPSYSPTSMPPPPPSNLFTGQSDGVKSTYAINEPYVNTFLNRPVECGVLY